MPFPFQCLVLLAVALCQLASANECNLFLQEDANSLDGRSGPDMAELEFLAEFSRFMNARAPKLLQVTHLSTLIPTQALSLVTQLKLPLFT